MDDNVIITWQDFNKSNFKSSKKNTLFSSFKNLLKISILKRLKSFESSLKRNIKRDYEFLVTNQYRIVEEKDMED